MVGPSPGRSPLYDVPVPAATRYAYLALRAQKLPLGVVLGRYQGTPRGARTCALCHASPDDEFHFLFTCPALKPAQDRLWGWLSRHYPAIANAVDRADHISLFRLLMCCPTDPVCQTLLAGPSGGRAFMRRAIVGVAALWAFRQGLLVRPA